MQRNNDINQVSMSSIEPAANLNIKRGDLPDNANNGRTKKQRKDLKHLNNKSSEKDDTIEQDLENVKVTDIPEFTIGPGGMTASVGREDKEIK